MGDVVEHLSDLLPEGIDGSFGGDIYGDSEARLRFAFQLARTLSEHDSPAAVQAWLTGVNPELGDRIPLHLLRENDIDAVAPATP